jgi:outer membrane protein
MRSADSFLRNVSFIAMLLVIAITLPCAAQSTIDLQGPPAAPSGGTETSAGTFGQSQAGTSPAQPNGPMGRPLSLKDAEALALKNNPAISVARLNALAYHQVTREVRSNLWPTAYANLTGVDAQENSRISAGSLNNPVIYERAAAGATVSQLITDFGHTTNLVASARLHAQAEDQNALATKEQVLLAVDQAFYAALQSAAVLKVAEQTVSSRQVLCDQVTALTKSKLRSSLDLSFANVSLAQARLLQLDAGNNAKAALANLSAILGFGALQNFELVEDTTALVKPPAAVDGLIAEAISQRPELLALEFESESAEKQHNADRDALFPTISALGAVGAAPVRNDHLSNWYGAVGVNVQIPVFDGFRLTARSHEAELQAQAANQRVMDLRNRISRDVRNSWLDASTAYERVSVSQQLMQQADQALNLADTRYRLGLSSIVELSQAQLQQTQAEIGSVSADYDYRLALSVLRYQTTGL